MPTTITTPAKMTDAQFATILFFAGGPTPRRQGIKVSSGMQTDAACLRRGWLVETDEHPYKKPTHEGMEAAGLYIDQHDGHATDIQETHWHCHTCRVYQAPHHARPAAEPTHLHTGLSQGNPTVCGEPVTDTTKTAPDIKDVDCVACLEEYSSYSILLRNELARFTQGEPPYDTEPESDPRRDAATARQLGMTKGDAVAVLEHITEATAVTDAYREVGGEVDPQTAAAADPAADPEMVAAGRDYLARELLTRQVLDVVSWLASDRELLTRQILDVVGWLASEQQVIKGLGGWLVHEIRPGAECRPIPDGVVEEAIRRGSARTYSNPLTGLTTLHLPMVGMTGHTLNPPPPAAKFVTGHRFDGGPDREVDRCIAAVDGRTCGMLEQAHLTTEYPHRAILDMEIAGHRLRDFVDPSNPGWHSCGHPHQTTNPAGYVVVWTVAYDGRLVEQDGGVGEDLAVFLCQAGPGFDPAYSDALEAAKMIRRMGRAWANVETLWPCGHRS